MQDFILQHSSRLHLKGDVFLTDKFTMSPILYIGDRSIVNDDVSVLMMKRSPQLPLPIDAGLHVRAQRNDFQLPYQIWWMYKHEEISVSQDPSNSYLKITESKCLYIVH